MNKLGNALYEIHHMDMLAAKDQWVNRLHPLVKLVLTIVFLTVTMSFQKYDLTGLLRMGIYPIVLFIVGEISFCDSIRRLRIVLPLVCFVGLFNPIFDRQVIGYIGTVPLTAGMLSMVTLMIKGIYSVLAAYLLIATTSIEKICYALRLLHIPAILVTQVLLTYRYVTVLLEEANRMTQAYSLRAPNQKGVHFKVWGTLAGQLAGIAIYEPVNLFVVHGIDTPFLLFPEGIGPIHHFTVSGGSGAGNIVGKAVGVFGTPGGLLIDGVIFRHNSSSQKAGTSGQIVPKSRCMDVDSIGANGAIP